MNCALCNAPDSHSWLYFAGKGRLPNIKGKTRVRGQVPLCDDCSETFFKHMKRQIPARLFTVALLLVGLLPIQLHAQTPIDSLHAQVDSLRADQIRQRAFNRSAETTGTRAIDRTDRVLEMIRRLFYVEEEPVGPPTVQDWRTGQWDVLAGGYRFVLDLTNGTASARGATAPVTAVAAGDTLRVRLDVPGYTEGLLEMVHAEGRMIGTVAHDTISRPASAQRLSLTVVQTVQQAPCTFAQYTDGSWGISPNTGECHIALDSYAGPLKFVARVYEP